MISERQKLETKLDALEEKNAVTEQAMCDLMKDLVKVSELLKNLVLLSEKAKPTEIERHIKILCVELLLDQNTAQFRPQTGLTPLFERKNSSCAPKEWFAELLEDREFHKNLKISLSTMNIRHETTNNAGHER